MVHLNQTTENNFWSMTNLREFYYLYISKYFLYILNRYNNYMKEYKALNYGLRK